MKKVFRGCEDLVKVNCEEQEEPATLIFRLLLDGHGTRVYGLPSSRHQEVYLPPHNNYTIIDTVFLPGVVISSTSPNISLSIFIDTLRRTSHL